MYDIETLSIDGVSDKEHFYRKIVLENGQQKLVPDLFIILVNNPKQPLHARNYFKDILKEDHQETLTEVTLFFLSNPVPFNRQNYQKQKGLGTSKQPLFRLRNKFRKIHLSVMYYLTKFDDVI